MADTSTKQKQPGTSRNMTGIVIGAAGAAVVLLLVVAVMFGSNEVGTEYGEPTVEGASLPLMPQNTTVDTSATGAAYPKVVGQDFEGDTVTIDSADGRAKGILFLAHWCSHCQAEVPRVQAWLDETGGVEGVDFYSVSTSMSSGRDNYPPSEWLEREGWSVPVIRDDADNSALLSYGAGGFPYWVFVNADGTVAVRTSGELQIDQLETILASLET
jgi:cytochrome c biogenesis protein CcmG/thiol:disulfide interchange protein DsbE